MALRSLTTRMWGPAAAYALRRHPGPGVPTPPPPPALSRFLGTPVSQAKPQSNIKRIQQEAVYVLELEYLLVELEKVIKVAKQRTVELEQVRRQKKKAQKIYGFTLAALSCMAVYLYNM